jgi:hypothetical protein
VFNQSQLRVLLEELAAVGAALTDEGVERAYNGWLTLFEKMDEAMQEDARLDPKPTKALLVNHIAALKELAERGTATSHLYLRFIGD